MQSSPYTQIPLLSRRDNIDITEISFMIFLIYREVIPDPDPELKSSSSSGKPDPASSKYKSSVAEGDLAAATAICKGDS